MSGTLDEQNSKKVVVGWREYVAFPEWGISAIRAKADTGARTSALDVENIEEIEDGRVRFEIVLDRRRRRKQVVEAPVIRRTRVRSSMGRVHERIVVRAVIGLGEVTKQIELGLVSRRRMLCRVLIGRSGLDPEFVVDSGRRYVFGGLNTRMRKASS